MIEIQPEIAIQIRLPAENQLLPVFQVRVARMSVVSYDCEGSRQLPCESTCGHLPRVRHSLTLSLLQDLAPLDQLVRKGFHPHAVGLRIADF